MEELFHFKIDEEDHKNYKRLDQFLNEKLPDLSRNFIKNLFDNNMITYDPKSKSSGKKLQLKKLPPPGSIIQLTVPPKKPSTAAAENIPLDILFEDEYLIFVNKAAGMVTHPAPGNYEGTLVNAILHHCPDLKGVGDEMRPGIVHRLDKGTSGVMVVAKDQNTHKGLVELFSSHDIKRQYLAIAMGNKFEEHDTLRSTIGRHPKNRLKMAVDVPNSKNAITHYKVKERFQHASLVEVTLETGRTHQIRVHLASLVKAPILCDPLYGNPKQDLIRIRAPHDELIKDYPHPFLHAQVLGLKHPMTGEDLYFEAKPPQIFQDIISSFRDTY